MAMLIYRKEASVNRKKTVMEGYEEYIEDGCIEDQRMPRKQRRTAKAMFKDLLKLGYQGSDRTVRDYVRKIKQRMRVRCPGTSHSA